MHLVTRRPVVLTRADMRQIYDAAIRVVRRVPLKCQATDEFYGYLRDFGCEVNGELVRFPAAVVDKAVGLIEEQRDRNLAATGAAEPDREEKPAASVDWGGQGTKPAEAQPPRTLSYSASGQAPYCCDVETGKLRLATVRDLADLSRVIDAIPNLGRAHPTFIPQDVPRATAELHAYATILLNASRSHTVSVYSARHIVRMA